MGRRRKDTTSTLDKPVKVALSDPQLLAKGRQLIGKLTSVKQLRRELGRITRDTKADIKTAENEIEQLRDEIESGYELRPQGDLFAQDLVAAPPKADPTPEEAKQALAQVAAAAGESAEKLGAELEAPAAADWPGRHVFNPDLGANSNGAAPAGALCTMCGRVEADALHQVVDGPAAVEVATTPPGCPACRAGECKVHPHAFVEADGGRCRCGYAKRAKVHKAGNGFDFDESEPAPNLIRTARAVDTREVEASS